MLGFVFCLPGCEDVEVGYMEVGNAGYSIDTLYLYNIEVRLAEYNEYQARYDESAGPINAQIAEKEVEYNRLDKIMDDLSDQLDELEWGTPEFDELYAQYEEVQMQWQDVENEIWDLKSELDMIAQQMGFNSVDDIVNVRMQLENRTRYDIPWVTAPIEGILGTEPMKYSIAGIKSASPENAELFRQALSIMGGGLMHVALDLKAPAGMYTVSVLVENEGQHAILEDAFTFVVEE